MVAVRRMCRSSTTPTLSGSPPLRRAACLAFPTRAAPSTRARPLTPLERAAPSPTPARDAPSTRARPLIPWSALVSLALPRAMPPSPPPPPHLPTLRARFPPYTSAAPSRIPHARCPLYARSPPQPPKRAAPSRPSAPQVNPSTPHPTCTIRIQRI